MSGQNNILRRDSPVLRAATKACHFLANTGSENVLLIMPNENDGFKLAGNILGQSMKMIESAQDCLLFLADGGLLKTISAENVSFASIVQLRYCFSVSGKLLTRLSRVKKRELNAREVGSLIVMGSPTYFSKLRHRGEITFEGNKINLSIMGLKRTFRLRRAVIFSDYLFQASPRSKLFTIGDLRKYSIPIIYIGTDADYVSIEIIQKAMLTENVFGFTNESLNRLGQRLQPKLDFKSLGYSPFILNEGQGVPDTFSECDEMFGSARELLEQPERSDPEDAAKLKGIFRRSKSIYKLLKSSSVPPLEVKYYSDRANHLQELRSELVRMIGKLDNEPTLSQAAMNIETGVAMCLRKLEDKSKSNAVRKFLEMNKDATLMTWSKPEAEFAKGFYGARTCSTKLVEPSDNLLFGGLLSPWRFFDAIRQANPIKIDLIGWQGEVDEYNEFRSRYSQASEFLYNRAVDVDRKIAENKAPKKQVVGLSAH
jgi:hypothetical protein